MIFDIFHVNGTIVLTLLLTNLNQFFFFLKVTEMNIEFYPSPSEVIKKDDVSNAIYDCWFNDSKILGFFS